MTCNTHTQTIKRETYLDREIQTDGERKRKTETETKIKEREREKKRKKQRQIERRE